MTYILKRYIIFYDIKNPKRLLKVSNILLDYGQRIQKSFFEAELDKIDVKTLISRLKNVIDHEEDSIKLFEVCENCKFNRISFGNNGIFNSYKSWEIF